MKQQIGIVIALFGLAGCGGVDHPDDHISALTYKLQPAADHWRHICQTGRACIEAAREDPADLIKACEEGWRIFQAIEAYQIAYCNARGLECSAISSD